MFIRQMLCCPEDGPDIVIGLVFLSGHRSHWSMASDQGTPPRTAQNVDAPYRLNDRYLADDGTVVLSGVQALARIPIEQLKRDRAAGKNTAAFVSGYPGSPLGGFDSELARALRLVPDLPIVHRPECT